MKRFTTKLINGVLTLFQNVILGGTTTTDGNIAGLMVVAEGTSTKIRTTRYIAAVGYASGATDLVTFTPQEAITRYRFKPDSVTRVVEDAVNAVQAEDWLNTGAADTASASADLGHYIVAADTWSEWQDFGLGNNLTNVYFCLDANVATGTLILEAE